MSTLVNPPPATTSAPQLSKAGTIFQDILLGLQIATKVMAVVPNPAQAFMPIAAQLESVAIAAIQAHMLASGKTVDELIVQLHDLPPL